MRILIADKLEQQAIDGLKRIAERVESDPAAKGDALAKRIAELDPQVLIVRGNKVTRDAMRAGKSLQLVVRAGSGYDTIDVAAASELGINVSNCPGMNAVAVAELTMGLIVALDRRIPDNVADFRAGKWNKKEYGKAVGLKGQTLGIVGAGRIGSEVARRALAFEMKVLYYNLGRTMRLVDFPAARRVEIDDLCRESDIVSLHVPGGEGTHHLIDRRRVGLLKPSALVVNTSRAGVLDEQALVEALKSRKVRAAALDVFEGEPPADALECRTTLNELPNLYVTHHIGASTEQAQLAVAEETVRIVNEYKATGRVLNCVNVRDAGGNCMLVVRLVNKPGGLALVFQHIAAADINIEEMDHVIYDGGQAACAHIRLSKRPDDATLAKLRGAPQHILGLEVTAAD